MTYTVFLQHLVNGLTLGSEYALVALGYTLIFGVMNLIFFAQGDLCMVGAFGGLAVLSMIGPAPSPIVALAAAFGGAAVASTVVGLAAERLAIRPLKAAPRTKQLVASLGVSMVLQNVALVGVSRERIAFPPIMPESTLSIGGVHITAIQGCILLSALCLMIALQYVLRRTNLGLRLRAVAESAENAELDGIEVGRTITATFVIGSVLAGFAGVMMSLYAGGVKYDMGFLPGIKGFTAAILGGFGSPAGAVLGGIILGLAEALASGYGFTLYKDVVAFVLLIGILLFKPAGLVGGKWNS